MATKVIQKKAHLPFSDMKYNTVFLFLMAMARIIFEFVKGQVNKVFGNAVPSNCRVKRSFSVL